MEKPKMTFLNYIPDRRYDIVGTVILKLSFDEKEEEIKGFPPRRSIIFNSLNFDNGWSIHKILNNNMESDNELEFDYIIDLKKMNSLYDWEVMEEKNIIKKNNKNVYLANRNLEKGNNWDLLKMGNKIILFVGTAIKFKN